ncbi:hypothetical protein FQR65_LT09660 [Abscondita terminalis]|nr:hypothetical protein FQR65_LT09660 [Abscondita terminalis]
MQVIWLAWSVLILAAASARSAAIDVPGTILTLNDLSQSDRDYLEYLQDEATRHKRSGDILGAVKSKITQGLKSKLSGFSSGSSHASSFLSGGSKGFHHYAMPPEDKTFNFWDLQKSIFHTLFQAAKAIKGGLLAIKGQLIKGSGYVISAKGKLITAKGEAITNIGKHIASSAVLVPRPHAHHTAPSGPSEPIYAEPPSSSGYSGPSGPNVEYHSHHYEHPPPSAIGDHKFPPYEEYKDHVPRATNQGLLIIKKIPKTKKEKSNGNNEAHITPETHKPNVESDGPNNHPLFTFLPDTNPTFSKDEPPTSYEQIPNYDSQPSHFEAPSSPGVIQNVPQEHVHTSQPASHLTKLEVYDPFSLPNGIQQSLTLGIPKYNIPPKYLPSVNHLENFPTYPLDLHHDNEAQYSTLVTDTLLPPPNLILINAKQPHVNSKLNSRLKRLPNNKTIKLNP